MGDILDYHPLPSRRGRAACPLALADSVPAVQEGLVEAALLRRQRLLGAFAVDEIGGLAGELSVIC